MSDPDPQQYSDVVSANDAIPDFGAMKAMQLTRFRWAVETLKANGPNTAYVCNPDEMECTCPDHKYNRENAEVCKHLSYVIHQGPESLGDGEAAIWSLSSMMATGSAAVERLQAAANGVDASSGGASTEQPSAAPETDARPEEEAAHAEAQSAAETLQAAFDEHLNDMRVQAHAGHVWFKTGYDTEEEWPYPGVDETFQAVTAPDCVEYVADGGNDYPAHELYDEKPGEYWKNALAPEDVEQYINEVLE